MANAQTIATKKWQDKNGITRKTFMTRTDLAAEFKSACERTGISQSSVLNQAMKEFIEAHPAETEAGE